MSSTLTICTAAAGSGKTFSLVKEYLKIILQNPRSYRNILAITFTNKATAEMKERVLNELEALSNIDMCPMKDALLEDNDPFLNKQKIESNARLAIQYILHDYSQLSIMTIDSFFQLLIKSFARELKIPIGTGIDLDTNYVITKSIEWLMEDIGENKILTNWLLEYVESKLDESKGWDLQKGIEDIGKEILGEQLGDKMNLFTLERIEELNKKLLKEIYQFEAPINKLCKKALFILQKNNLDKKDLKLGIFSFYEKGLFKLDDLLNGEHKTIQAWIDGSGNALSLEKQKDTTLVSNLSTAINEGLIEITTEIFTQIEVGKINYNTCKILQKNIYNLGIIHFLDEKIKQYRTEENTMLISDTRLLLNGLIGTEETPFIFEKIGNQYQHILLDEFQDTSNSQWDIIYPLVINILGQGGKVFIVGDAKQAIYKWRGGNVQLIVDQIYTDLGFFHPKRKILDTNYRSHRDIIEFNNLLFSKLQSIDTLKEAYEKCTQKIPPHNLKKRGYVEIEFIKKKTEKLEYEEEKAFQKALNKSCQLVLDLLSEGYRQQDIAILVNRKKEGLEIAQLLNQNQIKVISDNSLVFANYEPIKLLIHTFRLLLDSKNKTHYTHVLFLYVKLKKLPYEDEILLQNHFYLNKATTESLILYNLIPSLNPIININWSKKNIYELSEILIQIFDLQPTTDPFLLQFLDLVLSFFQKKNPSIKSFLDWWDFFCEHQSLVVSEEADAVKILTIHKAKGLEFPIVIMPWAEWEMTPKTNSLKWFNTKNTDYTELEILPINFTKKIADSHFNEAYEIELKDTFLENINLLYVAFTRAIERLYVFSTEGNSNKLGYLLLTELNAISSNDSKLEREDLTFRLGEKQLPSSKKKKETNIFEMTQFQKKEPIRKKINQSIKTKAITIGEFIHDILSKANSQEEMDKVLVQMQYLGTITSKQAKDIKINLQSIWALQPYKNWLENYKSISERDISEQGQLLRPDKIFYNEKVTIIVDFKTGKKSKAHQKQVKRYIESLQRLGFRNTIGCLLYISETPELELFT